MNTAAAVDLSVQVGALRLRNPILAASGTFGYGIEFAHLVDLNLLGGLVVKGLSREPIEGAPPPRIVETPSGMLNAIGLQNVGVACHTVQARLLFLLSTHPLLRRQGHHWVCSVMAHATVAESRVLRHREEEVAVKKQPDFSNAG